MIRLSDIQVSSNAQEILSNLREKISALRAEGPLDETVAAKLEEHFRAQHIFHSAGIEGNRLTLQETLVVLRDGIEISGKPLKDVIEVTNLASAYDHLKELAHRNSRISEIDIRGMHQLIVGKGQELSPGEYRKVGVVIAGSEHKPPEPIEVPSRMHEFVEWVNDEFDNSDPALLAIVSHHQLVAIHPFKDGNGRVSRLLMNLMLLRAGYPICNIRREDRSRYYEALGYADVGLYDDLVELGVERIQDLFREYRRIVDEGKRQREWAARWGERETAILHQRESREYELWKARTRTLRLEFEKAADLLSEQLKEIAIDYYDLNREITFDEYQVLKSTGRIEHSHAFRIGFWNRATKRRETFMFRYFRNHTKFRQKSVIPLEVNYLKQEEGFVRLSELTEFSKIRLREVWFEDTGELVTFEFDLSKRIEIDRHGRSLEEVVRHFVDDVLQHVVGLKMG